MDNASSNNDQQLLQKIKKGDAKAMTLLFKTHYPRLCYLAESLINNHPEAEDIAMRALASLWEQSRQQTNSTITNIGAWLYTLVRNSCFDYLKHQKVKNTSGSIINQQTPVDENYIEARLVQADIINRVYEEIQQLPGQCRRVAESIYIKGYSIEETASELNISASTVRSQKARAVTLLRTRFLKNDLLHGFILLFF